MWKKFQEMSKIRRMAIIYATLTGIGIVLITFALSIRKTVKYKLYENPSLGISIEYPDNWMVQEGHPEAPQMVVAFVSPKDNALDVFQENVTIVFQDFSKDPVTFKYYTERAIEQVTVVFKGYIDVLESRSITLAGRPGYRFAYKGKNPEDPSQPGLQMLHTWCMEGGKAYQVTYGALSTGYDKYIDVAEKMIKSFTIN